MSDPEPLKEKPPNTYTQIGMAMSIPMMLLSGPLVGYGLGWLIRRMTGWGPWVEAIMVGLGLIAGIREVINVIRKLS